MYNWDIYWVNCMNVFNAQFKGLYTIYMLIKYKIWGLKN